MLTPSSIGSGFKFEFYPSMKYEFDYAVISFQLKGLMLEIKRLGFLTFIIQKLWDVLASQFPSVGVVSVEHHPVRVTIK